MVFIASFLGLYASNVVFLLNTIFVKSHNNTTDKIILALDGISPKVYRWNWFDGVPFTVEIETVYECQYNKHATTRSRLTVQRGYVQRKHAK